MTPFVGCPDHGLDDLELVEVSTITHGFDVVGTKKDGTILTEGWREIASEPEDRWIECRTCSYKRDIPPSEARRIDYLLPDDPR